ncbi:MAG: hypothetical protein QOK49_3878, partial [Baekduia sp.]|nr:hypothetical protein [Baekduia sp.]
MRRHDAQDLWRRFGAGDGSAFAQLYRDHHRDVFRYCRSLLHDEQDAHDAAQGTWTAIWTAPGAARRGIPLRPWLFRVAHNEAISILRQRRAHDPLTDLEVPALDDVASDVELRDRLATLRADLVTLPERQRAALLLREVSGLGHKEIADVFGITAAAAKQTIYEARRALLEAEGGRSMACDLVRRAISDGDGRVRRGRRLRAHLRGCVTCRTFADAVGRRRRDLQLLFPAPAALGLLARATSAVSSAGAGGAASGGLVAAGGSVATKVAVAVVVVAAGVGGQHEIAHAGGARAKGGTASRAAHEQGGGATTTAMSRRSAQLPAPTAARTGGTPAAGGAGAVVGSTSTGPGGAGDPPARSTVAVLVPAGARQTAASDATSDGSSGGAPGRPAAAGPPEPPGRAKHAGDAPGQAEKAGTAGSLGHGKQGDTIAPPGRAKKTEAPTPPAPAGATGPTEPPGQAKKPDAVEPPGQAKKTDGPSAAAAGGDPPTVASPT